MMKNKFGHKKVLGRSIPTLVIAALFMAGAGSAALLTNFGNAQATAQVDQAVTVNGQSQSSGFECSETYSTFGGALEQYRCSLQNNADSPVAVSLSTSTSAADDDGNGINANGADTSYILYDQWAVGSSDTTTDVEVEASKQNVVKGDYSIHFESTGDDSDSDDYARVWYNVSGLDVSSGDFVTYEGVANTNNPLNDELWILTENGESFYDGGGSASAGKAEYQLDSSNFVNVDDQSQYSGNFDDVVAVGIGQGAPNVGGFSVDTYIDDVKVSGTSVDEPEEPSLELLPTGSFNGVDTVYRMKPVTDFATNVQPGDYTIQTDVGPLTS